MFKSKHRQKIIPENIMSISSVQDRGLDAMTFSYVAIFTFSYLNLGGAEEKRRHRTFKKSFCLRCDSSVAVRGVKSHDGCRVGELGARQLCS